jgi:gliding motility-associated-like protein
VKQPLLLFILSLLCHTLFSQTCPANIDFEKGDFSNWQCYTGTVRALNGVNTMVMQPSQPVAGRHEIIPASDKSKDPFGNFPVHCPYGGGYSVKLGNTNTGSEAEGLSYTFQVPLGIDTFTFTYFYAVVFEDPQHNAEEQPRFFVTAYDVLTGALINCASYDYIATSNLPGFMPSQLGGSILYKDWSPVSIQFGGLAGRQVRLEFRTADCTQAGHFGYAYVDVGTGCSNILASAPYCRETNSVILNAPYGFKTYTWYNEDFSAVVGNQQSITLSPPPATSGKFYVDLVPYPGFGCRDTAPAFVVPLPVPDTPVAVSDYTICQFAYSAALEAEVKPGHDLLWYSAATGGNPSRRPTAPLTSTAGLFTYYVSQKELFGCESFRKEIRVEVKRTPKSSFAINNFRQCLRDNVFEFTNNTTNIQNSTPAYTWDFGDGEKDTTYTTGPVKHTYKKHGLFMVSMKALNEPACFSSDQKSTVVIPKPIAAYSSPPVICELQTPVNLADFSYVPDNLSTVYSWWWSVNDKPVTGRVPGTFIPSSPGNLPVKLVVKTQEGCVSDTTAKVLTVRYRPSAVFKYSSLLCENEIIQFTDQSTLPASAATEFVAKWNWQFDNFFTTTMHHPDRLLTTGHHTVSLVAETNYGCKSVSADSLLLIHAKPHIGITVEDSCIMRSIRFTGQDLASTVNKWYWNFGNGFVENDHAITKFFSGPGNYPFTLLAKTVQGCKDTLVRPFTIYDNKAFAGFDTLAAINEPVQLNARGGAAVTYTWSPSLGLNDVTLENPVATLDRDQLYTLHSISDKGCVHDSKIFIKRFNGPDLYLPNAFTPNADHNNDVYHVFPVGISKFLYLSIYNRYGQQVYYTTDYKQGWDGALRGTPQEQGNYVVVAKAIDYRGQEMVKKGSMVLIR